MFWTGAERWHQAGDTGAVVEKRGLRQVTDTGAIEAAIDAVIAASPDKVADAKANPKAIGWFVGQVMKSTGGKANPQAVNDLFYKTWASRRQTGDPQGLTPRAVRSTIVCATLRPMNVALPRSLNVDEFLAWAVRQPKGKYELIDGVVIMQQAQQWGHSKVKFEVALALREAIEKAGVPYYVASDGPAVRVERHKAFIPDALVAPLPEPQFDSLEVHNPTIVVEVLSPSTARMDATTKLSGYFKVASVQHYLIVDPEKRTITHHKRSGAAVKTRTLRKGVLKLSPPGIELPLSEVFGSGRPKSSD